MSTNPEVYIAHKPTNTVTSRPKPHRKTMNTVKMMFKAWNSNTKEEESIPTLAKDDKIIDIAKPVLGILDSFIQVA
ncbi:MAG: hypothetical protein QXP50_01500 [Candidatus Methanomethylicia archaeon]